jgi:hypothetical protein
MSRLYYSSPDNPTVRNTVPNSFEVTQVTLVSGSKNKKLGNLRQVKAYLRKCADNCSAGFLDYKDDKGELTGFMFTMTLIGDKLYFNGVEDGTLLYLLESRGRKLYMTEQKKK